MWIGCAPLLTFFSHSCADTKCRTIDDDDPLEACGSYLSRETLYYLPFKGTRGMDSIMKDVLGVIRPALSLDCSANLLSFLCRTWFRECQKVPHDILGSTMLPSLMVRSMMLDSFAICFCSADSFTIYFCSVVRNVKSTLIVGSSASMRLGPTPKRKKRSIPRDRARSVI